MRLDPRARAIPSTIEPRRLGGPGHRSDLDHAPLVRADADRAVPLLDLDVEAQLAPVDDLLELGVGGAGLALGCRRNVLDADLEPHRRLALLEALEGERGGVALDHPD